MPRRIGLTVVATALLVACSSDSTGAAAGRVSVGNNFFAPSSVSPDGNGRVTWTWSSGGTIHNVTFDDLAPGSGDLGSGTFTRDFTGVPAGTKGYQCTIHPGMVGQVVVP